jgi:S-DNA-T family DNA segregation ATPase FtsK/SpoIIIE
MAKSGKAKSGSAKKRPTRNRPQKAKATRETLRTRKEILGLMLMAVAVLLIVSVFSYSRADADLASAFVPAHLVDMSVRQADNSLGLFGAYVAEGFVPQFLGYPVLLLGLLIFAWGYVVFRNHPARLMRRVSAYGVLGTLLVSSVAGWIGYGNEPSMTMWSGAWGKAIAGALHGALGSVGSMIFLALFALVLLRVIIDGDVQKSLDWFESRLVALRDFARSRLSAHREARSARKKEQELERKRAAEERVRQRLAAMSAEMPKRRRRRKRSRTASEDDGQLVLNDLFRDAPQPERLAPAEPALAGNVPKEPAAPSDSSRAPMEPELQVTEQIREEEVDLDKRPIESTKQTIPYRFPSVDLLDDDRDDLPPIDYDELEENKQILLDKLQMYNIEIVHINAIVGPTVTLYELTPAPGVKISRIKSLEADLAMAMAARGIRMITPIPGKSAIGVEIPNRYRELVRIRSVISTARFRDAKLELPIAIGKTIEGEVFVQSLGRMPHLLIAGATGSGKSVGLNCLIACLMYACHPDDLKFVMIDPKRIELQQYARIFDHFLAMPEGGEDPITTDFKDAMGILKSCLKEMEIRYDLLSDAGVRTIKEYNKRWKEGRLNPEHDHRHLPHIVVIIDELADLMMTTGKEIEAPIARLAQMARAVGIHLVVATQRPSVNVITGLIKANFPSRIAYQVATGVDSRTILDQYGAEQLVGNGDMLFMSGSQIVRLQSPYISLDEIEAITNFVASQPTRGTYLLPAIEEEEDAADLVNPLGEDLDPLFADAARTIVRNQQGSVSLLQRKLSVGYARAARMVDQLERAGIVGPFEGSKARQVLIADELQLDDFLNNMAQNNEA